MKAPVDILNWLRKDGWVLRNQAGSHCQSKTGYGANAPDLPGCVATGRTIEETRQRMAKAIEMHLSAIREDGDTIPEPSHFELVEAS